MDSVLDPNQDSPLTPATPLSPFSAGSALASRAYTMPDDLKGVTPDVSPQPKPDDKEEQRPAAPPRDPNQPTMVAAAPQAQQQHREPKPMGAANDAAGVLRQFEGFRAQPYWDTNHWRVGYGSDTVTRADGKIEPVTAFTHVSKEDAERDLARRVGVYQNDIARQIGPDAWAALSPATQASLTSIAYNYGHLPDTVASAAARGDVMALAAAVAALPSNPARRQQEAYNILNGANGAPYGGLSPLGAASEDPDAPAANAATVRGDAPPLSWNDLARIMKKPAAKTDDSASPAPPASWGDLAKAMGGGADWNTKIAAGLSLGSDVLPIGEDPDKIIKQQAELGKGFVSGAAQDVTGIGELLPSELGGGKAAEATRWLQTKGDKSAQTAGGVLAPLLAAPLTAGLGAGGEAVQAASKLKPFAQALVDAAKTGVIGALWGSTVPTGEADWSKRMTDKAPAMMIAGGLGLLGSLGFSAYSTLRGGGNAAEEAAKAAEAMRSMIIGEAEKVKGYHSATASEKQAIVAAKEAELTAHMQEMERIAKARMQIEESAAVRAAKGRDEAGAGSPEAMRDIKERVVDRMRGEVRAAEQAAQKAGLDAADARKFVVEQQQHVLDAETAGTKLAEEQASKGAGITKGELGQKVQDESRKLYEKYSKARAKESGFAEVMKDEGHRSIDTSGVLAYVDEMESKVSNPATRAAFNYLRKEATTAAEEGDPLKNISLDKADDLRKTLNMWRAQRELPIEGGTGADASTFHHLGELVDALEGSAKSASPNYGKALQKYAELSRPLDIFGQNGALQGVVARNEYSGQFIMDSGRVVDKLLGGQNQEAVQRMLVEKPELRDALRAYYMDQLFGPKEIEGAVGSSEKTFDSFLRKNRPALEKSGLMSEFVDMNTARKSAKAMVERAQAEAQAAKTAEAESVRIAKESQRVERDAQRTRDAALKRSESAASAGPSVEDVAKDAAGRVKEADKRLKGHEKDVGAKVKATQGDIDRLAKEAAMQKDIEKHWDAHQTIMQSEKPEDVARVSKTFLKEMLRKDYISNDEYSRMIAEVQELDAKYQDKAAAAGHMKKLRNLITASFIGDMAARIGFKHLRTFGL